MTAKQDGFNSMKMTLYYTMLSGPFLSLPVLTGAFPRGLVTPKHARLHRFEQLIQTKTLEQICMIEVLSNHDLRGDV